MPPVTRLGGTGSCFCLPGAAEHLLGAGFGAPCPVKRPLGRAEAAAGARPPLRHFSARQPQAAVTWR